jgi:hypothetical protein
MKIFYPLLACIIFQTSFGQFAIVDDKDGYVNIRSSPEVADNIKDTLQNGHIVFCIETKGSWHYIDYKEFRSGYIHKSRLKTIENFKKVNYISKSATYIIFNSDTIRLTLTKESFNPEVNVLHYNPGNANKNVASYLESINGSEFWGTDGDVPRYQYGQITLQIGDEILYLPSDNLYEPNLNYTFLNVDRINEVIYLSALNSDGAGGYAVLWIIEKGKFKKRILTRPF